MKVRVFLFLVSTLLIVSCTNTVPVVSLLLDEDSTASELDQNFNLLSISTTSPATTNESSIVYTFEFNREVGAVNLNAFSILDTDSIISNKTVSIDSTNQHKVNLTLYFLNNIDAQVSIQIDNAQSNLITDIDGNSLFNAVTFSPYPSIDIDRTSPGISQITTSSSNITLTNGQSIDISIQFNEPVTITAGGYIELNSSTTHISSLTTGIATTHTFRYTVQSSDYSNALDLSQLYLTITDEAQNSSSPSLSGLSISSNQVKIYGTPASVSVTPSSTSLGNLEYLANQTLSFTVTNQSANVPIQIQSLSATSDVSVTYLGGTYPGTGGTCGSNLAAASSCTILMSVSNGVIGSHSFSWNFSYQNGISSVSMNSTANIIWTTIPRTISIQQSYASTANQYWNNHVLISTMNNVSPTLCTGAESSALQSPCLHIGKFKQFDLNFLSSCSGLTVIESQNWFDWNCQIVSGIVRFSGKLKKQLSLKNLINSTPDWIENSVSINHTGQTIAQSTTAPWWHDNVIPISSVGQNTTSQQLHTSNTVYVASASNYLYSLIDPSGQTGISIITLNSVVLTYNNSTTPSCSVNGTSTKSMICLNNSKFSWIEVDLNGAALTDAAIQANGLRFSQIQNSTIYNSGAGIDLKSSSNNLLSNLQIAKYFASNANAIKLNLSNYNKLQKIKVADGGTNASAAIQFISSNYNSLATFLISNISGNPDNHKPEGIHLNSNSNSNVISQGTIFNVNDSGVFLDNSNSNLFSHLTIANNKWNAIFFAGSVSGNLFNSLVAFHTASNLASNPSTSSSTSNEFLNSINAEGISSDVNFSGGGSYVATGFTNPLDPQNTVTINSSYSSNVTLSANYSTLNSISAWFPYPTDFFTGFGADHTLLDNNTMILRGCDDTNSCKSWNWKVTSGPLFNMGVFGNTASPLLANYCSNAIANKYKSFNGKLFITNAIEIIDDEFGNNDGICEVSEKCVYAPNIGSYHGSGDPTTTTSCSTSDTATTNYILADIYSFPSP